MSSKFHFAKSFFSTSSQFVSKLLKNSRSSFRPPLFVIVSGFGIGAIASTGLNFVLGDVPKGKKPDYIFPDSGLLYYGPLKDGKPFGKGKIFLVDEKGEIQEYSEIDSQTGETISIDPTGDEIFIGKNINNIKKGKFYFHGDIFDASSIVDGKIQGPAFQISSRTNCTYFGNFQNNLKHGLGNCFCSHESSAWKASHSSGEWKEDSFMTGARTMILNDGNTLTIDLENGNIKGGRWIGTDNKMVPKTKEEINKIFDKIESEAPNPKIPEKAFLIDDKSSDFYLGYYIGNTNGIQPDGKGKIVQYSSKIVDGLHGPLYEGQWKNGKPHGVGKLIGVDNTVYEGEFIDNKKHGKGKFFVLVGGDFSILDNKEPPAPGVSMEGEWKDDVFHNGIKSILNADGTVVKVNVKDGKFGDRVVQIPYLKKEINISWKLPK